MCASAFIYRWLSCVPMFVSSTNWKSAMHSWNRCKRVSVSTWRQNDGPSPGEAVIPLPLNFWCWQIYLFLFHIPFPMEGMHWFHFFISYHHLTNTKLPKELALVDVNGVSYDSQRKTSTFLKEVRAPWINNDMYNNQTISGVCWIVTRNEFPFPFHFLF